MRRTSRCLRFRETLLAILLFGHLACAANPSHRVSEDDKQYRLAAQYYEAGDFEKALLLCKELVAQRPDHDAGKALLLECEFIIHRQRDPALDDFAHHRIGHQQVLVEMDQALARAKRALNNGNLMEAEKDAKWILELAIWFEDIVEVCVKRREAESLLDRIKELKNR